MRREVSKKRFLQGVLLCFCLLYSHRDGVCLHQWRRRTYDCHPYYKSVEIKDGG